MHQLRHGQKRRIFASFRGRQKDGKQDDEQNGAGASVLPEPGPLIQTAADKNRKIQEGYDHYHIQYKITSVWK